MNRIFMVATYAPVNGSTNEEDEFWNEVHGVLDECDPNEKKRFERILGRFEDKRTNENGKRLLNVCIERGLFLTNTMFCHKDIHMYTWERKNERSMIDFIVVDSQLRELTRDVQVFQGAELVTEPLYGSVQNCIISAIA